MCMALAFAAEVRPVDDDYDVNAQGMEIAAPPPRSSPASSAGVPSRSPARRPPAARGTTSTANSWSGTRPTQPVADLPGVRCRVRPQRLPSLVPHGLRLVWRECVENLVMDLAEARTEGPQDCHPPAVRAGPTFPLKCSGRARCYQRQARPEWNLTPTVESRSTVR